MLMIAATLFAASPLPPLPCEAAALHGLGAPATWRFRGPGSYSESEGAKLKWSSAAAAVAVSLHGKEKTPLWYVGAVNGGVWRTKDGMGAAKKQHWEPVTDSPKVRCQSIGALTTGSAVGLPDLVVAGCGASTSSMMGVDWNMADTGDFGGVMLSADAGDTWNMMEGFAANANVGAVEVLRTAGKATLLVGVRSHTYDRNSGGIWRATIDVSARGNAAAATFAPVFTKPVYAIASNANGVVLAAVAFEATHSVVRSLDGGATWTSFAEGVDWAGRVPFYPALSLTAQMAFVGALTVKRVPGDERMQTDTSGAVFYRNLSDASATWVAVPNTPRLDNDCMPKDRMALLADPDEPEFLYVAGNARYNTYRVNFAAGQWTDLKGPDGSEPHSDDRNYAWDPTVKGGRLVLVSDGGVSVRDSPRASAPWRSANGDMGTMEMLAASYDPVGDRWIACAQDNSCMLSPSGAKPTDVAVTVVGGDGTVTAVDVHASPPRLFGGVQSFGTDDDEEEEGDEGEKSASPAAGYSGLRFVQGDNIVDVPVPSYFEPRQMPYFVQPFALNAIEPTKVLLWANSTQDGTGKAGVYEFSVPYGITKGSQIGKPSLVASTPDDCYMIVSGGIISGKPNENLLFAMSADTLYVRASTAQPFEAKPLPVQYARPITKLYDAKGHKIESPTSHGKTVSLAVSAADARTVAVTGWPSVLTNVGVNESIWLSTDLGGTWSNVFGNLAAATSAAGPVRPGGLLLVKIGGDEALLAGTINGVFVSFLSAPGKWKRLGMCDALPLVMVYTLQHEAKSDTLVAATMGRGVYTWRTPRRSLRR